MAAQWIMAALHPRYVTDAFERWAVSTHEMMPRRICYFNQPLTEKIKLALKNSCF